MKKSYTINIPVFKFWTIILPLALIIMGVGIVVGIIVVDRVVMPNLPGINDRGIVDVPKVKGLEWEEARQKMYDDGLRLKTQYREYNDSIPANTVITQQPEAGEKVKKGRHIFVVVSNGPEVDTLPAVKKLTERLARKELAKAGFKDITIDRKYHDDIEKDHVTRIEPKTGTVTSRETPITITLSKGPRPTHAVAPNIIGDMLSDAKSKIEDSGLKLGTVKHKSVSGARIGSVISQSVSPGTNAPLESKVNVVVASKKVNKF